MIVAEPRPAGLGGRRKLGGSVTKRHVHPRVQLALDEEVGEDAEQDDDCSERRRRREDDAPAERHGSLRRT